ncbi:DegT/DnrJ/EryC1/StrS family aminotransferase [Magnetofaba australis]|uniref:DegT/DnrJ/EryC1/StrS family aminotransferase n=1 Tax=Magnetofaba australis TaxID=1472297 RepID=UPI000A19DF52|nr:DegT/DnrJ/EryC1/StrS family aminotransferase [Magnetofaba australis]
MTASLPVFSRPSLGPLEAAAASEAVLSGWVAAGPHLQAFEEAFAARCGAQFGIGVSSWTTGAFLVLKAWGLGHGAEVIVPSLTFIASVNVIRHVGARPVFADIDPLTFNIDPAAIEAAITPKTRAIIAVDQIGLPCDMHAIRAIAEKHNLLLLDDAACAVGSLNQGRPVGSLAPVSVFSLHARKVITTGEGGMILTDDAELAERVRRLRNQGMSLSALERHNAGPTTFESYPEIGYNARMTDIQAAVGNVQLARLDDLITARSAVADRYNARLAGHPLLMAPHAPEGMTPNWQSYQVTLKQGGLAQRNALMEQLHAAGVGTRRGVMPSHREGPYAESAPPLPHTEFAADCCILLPMHAEMTPAQADAVMDVVDRCAP